MNPNFDLNEFDVPSVKKKNWIDVQIKIMQIFPTADIKLVDLFNKIMIYNPKKRLTAGEVLAHSYFDEIREKTFFLNLERKIDTTDFFTFNESKIFLIKDNSQKQPRKI